MLLCMVRWVSLMAHLGRLKVFCSRIMALTVESLRFGRLSLFVRRSNLTRFDVYDIDVRLQHCINHDGLRR